MPVNCPVLLTEIQVLQAEIVDLYAQLAVLQATINQKQSQLATKQVEYYVNCT